MKVIWILPPGLLVAGVLLFSSTGSSGDLSTFGHSAYKDLPEYTRSSRNKLEIGRNAVRNGDYDTAIDFCKGPTGAEDVDIRTYALICLAYAYKGIGSYEKAIETFEKLVEVEAQQGLDTTSAKEQIAELKEKI